MSTIAQSIDEHLDAHQLKEALQLLADNRNEDDVRVHCADLVQILLKRLTPAAFVDAPDLYMASERLLTLVAAKAGREEVLFELLEAIESVHDDEVFTSVLKALQTVLLRVEEKKYQALGWCLDSVATYVTALPFPDVLRTATVGEEEERLIENDGSVNRILKLYLTVFLFLEPLVKKHFRRETETPFKAVGLNTRTVMLSFVLRLLGKPFVYLKVDQGEDEVQSYSRQCAETLAKVGSELLGDVYSLLDYVEAKVNEVKKEKKRIEDYPEDVFLNEERVPTLGLVMFYYLTFAERLGRPQDTPKVYRSEYILEKGLFTASILLSQTESALQFKGIHLGKALITQFALQPIVHPILDPEIVKTFFERLIHVVVYSSVERNRKQGVQLFTQLLKSHAPATRLRLFEHLLRTIEHDGLLGYLIVLFKDFLIESPAAVPEPKFHQIMLEIVCRLKDGEQSDLMDAREQILAALNMLIFLLIRRHAGMEEIAGRIEDTFLKPLRVGIDMSKAHYKGEKLQTERGENDGGEKKKQEAEVSILNGAPLEPLSKEKKLEIITYGLNSLDLMDSLLARVNEFLEKFCKKF